MVSVVARQAMTLRAAVNRWDSDGSTYGWGGQPTRSVVNVHTALPCQYWTRNSGPGLERDDNKTSVIRSSVLMVPAGTDIQEGDLIASIVDRNGQPTRTEFDGNATVRVNRVMPRRSHIELEIESYHGG